MTASTRPEVPAYDPATIESTWQERWRERGTNNTNLEGDRKFYALMMFPYPSAEGLHVGNLFAFTGNDIYGRFQRLQGHTVFEPLGYDAFGIHSENFALKQGIHPKELIPRNVANFRRQLQRAGLMVDWRYEVDTTQPDYYKWTQWVFLKLLEKGLAYKKKAAVNWCPNDKTVLANEQVVGGQCERCGAVVEQRFLEQWFFRITDYAGRLLDNLDRLDWSETTKTAQRNWIGRSDGAEITFPVPKSGVVAGEAPQDPKVLDAHEIRVFTTRADTIFGATYIVLAPEHPLVPLITSVDQSDVVGAYRASVAKQDLVSRKTTDKEKTGVFTGAYALNQATGKLIPVWIADYVLMEYGTGAIMAVPGHDERDHEFAKKFDLPIVEVVSGGDVTEAAYTGDGALVNSGQFDGLSVEQAKRQVTDWLADIGAARPVVNYRLHDWCISRQRYWGPPIPVVYCDACGMQPVPESQLPVELPDIEDIKPDDSGISPLARDASWYRVPCPKCGAEARRETDVSDTFLDSAWYFLRYPSVGRDDVPFDATTTKRWLPVDSYIGGNEHAVLHLLYARFVTMVLHDMGYVDFDEPFTKFRAHGLIVKDGAKMSKSRGNVIVPDDIIREWGADAFRTYLMFLGPYEEGGDYRTGGISGVKRFLDRLWNSVWEAAAGHGPRASGHTENVAQRLGVELHHQPDETVLRKLHATIKKVGDDIPRLSYNTAIAAMMEYMNVLRAGERLPRRAEVEPLVQLVSPFAPHVAEELWKTLGHEESVFDAGWPSYDPAMLVEDTIELVVQVNGKLRGRVRIAADVSQEDAFAAAREDAGIAKFITGTPKKIVYVPKRLLNIVV